MNSRARITAIVILALAASRLPGAPNDAININSLSSTDPAIRTAAIEAMKGRLAADPRAAATEIFKSRAFDIYLPNWWNPHREHDADVADIALRCINGQPDSTDRVAYFLEIRARALLLAGKPMEAVTAAKSLFRLCAVENTGKSIALLGECLTAAYPGDPGIVRRMKLQMLGSGTGGAASVLSSISVDEKTYSDASLNAIRNHDWRDFATANLKLMQDHPEQARPLFVKLLASKTDAVRLAAQDGVRRAEKSIQPASP